MLENRKAFEPSPELIFDKKRSRVKFCPCGKDNKDGKFVPYVGHENKGYCHSCGETFLPELSKVDEWNLPMNNSMKLKPSTFQSKPISYIPDEVFIASMNQKAIRSNCFIQYLISLFGEDEALGLVKKYNIATSKYWKGAVVFWQKDLNERVRTGKVILYNSYTGKRIKDKIHWVHSLLKQPDFELKQCLFGEHLLIDKSKPVAIVEAEKTAIISSVYFPEFIWVATGGKEGLTIDKCSILNGRDVVLFPDLSNPKEGETTTFEKWRKKSKELSHLANFHVSDLLERNATESERANGLDIADFLIKYKHEKVRAQRVEPITPPPSADDLIFQAMAKENLHLLDFVNALDLVNPYTMQPYRA